MKKLLAHKKKLIFSIVAVLIAVIAIKKIYDARKPLYVKVLPIERKSEYQVFVDARGQVKPMQEAFLTLKKGGRLDRYLVKVGDAVKIGQMIATVDEATGRAGLQSAISKFSLASSDFKRVSDLMRSGAVTRQELDQASSTFSVSRSELEQAKQKLEDSIVRSPIDGVVGLLAFRPGDFLPDGARLGTIEDRSAWQIVVSIPAKYKSLIQKEVDLKIKSQNLHASIRSANPLNDYDGMDTDMIIQFKDLPKDVNPGEAVDLRIPVKTYKNVVVLSSRLIVYVENQPQLVIRGDKEKLSWFQPKIIETQEDRLILESFPEGADAVLPEPLDAIKGATEKHKVARILSAPVLEKKS